MNSYAVRQGGSIAVRECGRFPAYGPTDGPARSLHVGLRVVMALLAICPGLASAGEALPSTEERPASDQPGSLSQRGIAASLEVPDNAAVQIGPLAQPEPPLWPGLSIASRQQDSTATLSATPQPRGVSLAEDSSGSLVEDAFLPFDPAADSLDDCSEHAASCRLTSTFETCDACDAVASSATTGEYCPRCGRVHPSAKDSAYPTVKVTGLGQLDAVWFGQDAANMAVLGDIQDGADIRRGRIGALGDLAENVGYYTEIDFGFLNRLNITDVYIDLRDVPLLGTVRIGRWRLPFNMDALTSVKELTFLERSLPFIFSPFRQIGVGFQQQSADESTTLAASVFRFPTDEFGGNVGDDGGYSVVTRLTHALPLDGRRSQSALHLGGAYSLIDPASDLVRYSAPPEIDVRETGGGAPLGVPSSTPPFADTGLLATDYVNLLDGEMAFTHGPLHAQSEVVYALVDRQGGANVAFPGVYAQVAYVLTGENRPYNWQNAVLGRVVPQRPLGRGGLGAWEVAFRYSWLDLRDADVDGGVLTDLTAGLNWYWNAKTKVQLNYIHAFLQRPGGTDSDADIVAARAQLDF